MKLYYHNSYLNSLFDSTFYTKICRCFEKCILSDVIQIQLYDDYISENFTVDDYVYYPVTLITKKGADVYWIRWKKKAEILIDCYKNIEEVESANNNVPVSFKNRISERAFYFHRQKQLAACIQKAIRTIE